MSYVFEKKQKKQKKLFIFLIFVFLIILIVLFLPKDIKEERKEAGDEFKEILFETRKEVSDLKKPLEPIEISPNIVSPEYSENLEELKEEVNNNRVLVKFLNDNFQFIKTNTDQAKSPEEFLQSQIGNALDVAVFSAYILQDYSDIAGVIVYEYDLSDYPWAVTIFRSDDLPKYISIDNDNQVKIFHHGYSYEDLIVAESVRKNCSISRWFYSSYRNLDLSEPKEPYSWQISRQD